MTHSFQRTWLPKLLFILNLLCSYILRYKLKIQQFIPEADWPKLDAVLLACEALRDVIIPIIDPP